MLGVVLWSNISEGKAVIWCEDHGDLAFWNAAHDSETHVACAFDAGDLVQFQLFVDAGQRRVRNPSLIAEKQFNELGERLVAEAEIAPKAVSGHGDAPQGASGGTVIPFRPRPAKENQPGVAFGA